DPERQYRSGQSAMAGEDGWAFLGLRKRHPKNDDDGQHHEIDSQEAVQYLNACVDTSLSQLHIFKVMITPPRNRMRPRFESPVVILAAETTSTAGAFQHYSRFQIIDSA